MAIDDLTLALEAGCVTAILGPSGCGKTTLLQIIAGLEPPTSGQISEMAAGPLRLGYVFQRDRLLPWRTVLQNAVLGLEFGATDASDAKARAEPLLHQLGLSEFLNAYPDSLSEGMRQRVALCRALVVCPNLLLLDEPLGSLDLEARLAAEALIRNYTKENVSVTLIVTHDLDEAIAVADRLVLLTPRPARIKGCWDVGFKKSDDDGIAVRNEPAFREFLADLVKQIMETHGRS